MARTRGGNARNRGQPSQPQPDEGGPSTTPEYGESSQPSVESMIRVAPNQHRSIKATTNVRIILFFYKL